MVVAANPLAAEAGLAMLRKGGSAVDAAIATQMVLNLVEPQSSGIGGGAFMLYWDAAHQAACQHRRPRDRARSGHAGAASSTPTASRSPRDAAMAGGRSVGVPGVLRGAGTRPSPNRGKLPWADAVRAGDRARRAGLRVGATAPCAAAARSLPEARRAGAAPISSMPTGSPGRGYNANPALAATLRAIAPAAPRRSIAGAIAADIVRTVAGRPRNPGELSLADLSRLSRQAARAGLRRLSRLSRLRHGATVLRRA